LYRTKGEDGLMSSLFCDDGDGEDLRIFFCMPRNLFAEQKKWVPSEFQEVAFSV
jgi:hypothetical protein